jgi:hypothetical protein
VKERFIKFIDSEESDYLLTYKPKAFLLLTHIAKRVRICDSSNGLKRGEAFIGDHESYQLTRQEYRTALEVLIERKHLLKIETCRSRKKFATTEIKKCNQTSTTETTTETTTVGTKVRLISSTVYDLNLNIDNHRNNHQDNQTSTTEVKKINHEQRMLLEELLLVKKEQEEKKVVVLAPFIKNGWEEDLQVLMTYVQERKFDISEDFLSKWIHDKGIEFVTNNFMIVLGNKKPFTSGAGALLNAAFNNDYAGRETLRQKNMEIAKKFKEQFKLNELKILKRYARDEDTNDDFQYSLPSDQFVEILKTKFKNKR